MKVTLQPSGHYFQAEGHDSLLDSALRSGLALKYGCSSGNCGDCQARLISGEIEKIRHCDYQFTEAEKVQGAFLMCSNRACSDLVVEATEAREANDIPIQHATTRLRKRLAISQHLTQIQCQTPRTQRLRFLAGQFVTLVLEGGESATLPISSCPCDDRNLEFLVSSSPADEFRARLDSLDINSPIAVEGPFGEYLFNEDSAHPHLFIAEAEGIGPIKSLIEHAMALELTQALHCYWAGDVDSQLVLGNLFRSYSDAFDNFWFFASPDAATTSGPIIDQLDRDGFGTEAAHVYLAGSDGFVDRINHWFQGAGQPKPNRIFLNSPKQA